MLSTAFPAEDATRRVLWDLMLKRWSLRAATADAPSAYSAEPVSMNVPRKCLITSLFGGDKMAKDRKIDLVILGLLSHEDLTGYDIKKRIDGSISFFWKGSFGSIYPALNEMEKSGLVKKKEAKKSSGREKIMYHITAAGRKVLADWLKDEQASNDLKYETLLKIYFGGSEDKAVTISNIEAFEKQIKENLELLKLYKENLESVLDEEGHINYYLTVTFGIDTYEAYLKWCTKAKKLIRGKR